MTTPVLDLLKSMTAESIAVSGLDPDELMVVRLAALVAVDAPAASYLANLEAIDAVGINADRIRGVLAAIAPIVGTARVASATVSIVEALEIEIEVAELARDRHRPGEQRLWPRRLERRLLVVLGRVRRCRSGRVTGPRPLHRVIPLGRLLLARRPARASLLLRRGVRPRRAHPMGSISLGRQVLSKNGWSGL